MDGESECQGICRDRRTLAPMIEARPERVDV